MVLVQEGTLTVLRKCEKFQSNSFESKGEHMDYNIYLNVGIDRSKKGAKSCKFFASYGTCLTASLDAV